MAAWTEPETSCKRHSNHTKQPGVCSSCLRERLYKLSADFSYSSSRNKGTASSSCSSCLSHSPAYYCPSGSSSTRISPPHNGGHRRHHRVASDVLTMSSISFVMNRTSTELIKKSRSIAFVAKRQARGAAADGKKKIGFWSKLRRKFS